MVLPSEIRAAAEGGDTEAIVEWFSTDTRDPDERCSLGQTLLHWAAARDQCDVMRIILAHGATVDARTRYGGVTPLHKATNFGEHAAAVLLLERGAELEARTQLLGTTPLHYAADNGLCDMIRLLLHRGAALDARDDDNDDAEARARSIGNPEAAALLAAVRVAGGWRSFVRVPRKRVLALRILCEQGRASTTDALLGRLFPYFAPGVEQDQPPPLLARAAAGPREVPKEVFWLVFAFWRCTSHDSPY